MHPQSPMAVRRPVFRRDARGLMVTGCDAAGAAAIEAFGEIALPFIDLHYGLVLASAATSPRAVRLDGE